MRKTTADGLEALSKNVKKANTFMLTNRDRVTIMICELCTPCGEGSWEAKACTRPFTVCTHRTMGRHTGATASPRTTGRLRICLRMARRWKNWWRCAIDWRFRQRVSKRSRRTFWQCHRVFRDLFFVCFLRSLHTCHFTQKSRS